MREGTQTGDGERGARPWLRTMRLAALVTPAALALSLFTASPSVAAAPEPSPTANTAPTPETTPALEAVPDTIRLDGALRVVPHEPELVDGGALDPDAPATGGSVSLVTADGTVVEIDGEALDGAVSGDEFSGTVAVPEEIAASVDAQIRTDDLAQGSVDVGELVTDAASAAEATLTVTDGTLAPQVDAAVAPRTHLLDVMFAAPAGTTVPTSATIDAAISRMSAYWTSQSNGQISSITRQSAVRYAQLSTSQICDAEGMWDYASGPSGFNRTGPYGDSNSYYWGAGNATHLLVIVPRELCTGYYIGLGTIGDVHAGGEIWATVATATPLDWDQVLSHEFGHNLGLGHSNVRQCSYPLVDAAASDSQCTDAPYGDYYDVMSGGYRIGSYSNERNLSALNVTHAELLDAVPLGTALREVNASAGASQRVTLSPISAVTGIRGLKVIDPLTGDELFVEYRSGTGRDATSFYTQFAAGGSTAGATYAPGLRVLKQVDSDSTVLRSWQAADRAVYSRDVGVDFASYMTDAEGRAGVRITPISLDGTSAVVDIAFDTLLPVTPGSVATRLAGSGRYETAVEISKATYPAGSVPVVYIANGTNFPDALAGAPAAGLAGGPILLTPAGTLPAVVAAELDRLDPAKIVVLGGPPAVSDSVQSALSAYTAGPVTRLAGPGRYDTAVAISRETFPGTAVGVPVVYIASGANFPDALAGAPAAVMQGSPILLTQPDALPSVVAAELDRLAPQTIIVLGGQPAVSDAVQTQLAAHTTGTVTRLAGSGRYETAVEISKDTFPSPGVPVVYIASGSAFPDALAGAPTAGRQGGPVLLTQTDSLPAAVAAELERLDPATIIVLGGPPAVSDAVRKQLAAYLP